MQKFTRPLTREIEISGKRLAVTLDENGVSVRPVGSRKPPKEIMWSALICVLAGDGDLDRALASFETANATAGKENAPPEGLAAALARLDTWFSENREDFAGALLDGAQAAELNQLEKKIGHPLPADVKTLFMWHNGQDEEIFASFYETFFLVGTANAAKDWQECQEEALPGWKAHMLPIMEDNTGNFIVVDLSTSEAAVLEFWQGRTEPIKAAASLREWFETFVSEIEGGRYEEEPERGEFTRVKKRKKT
jgi:cell wall assembly regulator SMI1